MKFKVGDFVCMPADKYEDMVYGIIILCNEKRSHYRVSWLDGYGETIETDKSIYWVGEKEPYV